MYDALVAFIGEPPAGCEQLLYLAAIPLTIYIVSEFYSLLRILCLRVVSKYERS